MRYDVHVSENSMSLPSRFCCMMLRQGIDLSKQLYLKAVFLHPIAFHPVLRVPDPDELCCLGNSAFAAAV